LAALRGLWGFWFLTHSDPAANSRGYPAACPFNPMKDIFIEIEVSSSDL
jgi:hypothetical protein